MKLNLLAMHCANPIRPNSALFNFLFKINIYSLQELRMNISNTLRMF